MGGTCSRSDAVLVHNPEVQVSSSSDRTFSSHYSPTNSKPRALSLPTPLVHHPPIKKGDTHHLVSLKSTTYGSLLLMEPVKLNLKHQEYPDRADSPPLVHITKSLEDKNVTGLAVADGVLSPDTIINTWELMDGLDEPDDDCDQSDEPTSVNANHQIEFTKEGDSCNSEISNVGVKKPDDSSDFEPKKLLETKEKNLPSLGKLGSDQESEKLLLDKMDSNAVSFGSLSPKGGTTLKSTEDAEGKYSLSQNKCRESGADDGVILYFTSLRGIRKTYEDCCSVRLILRSFRVPVDERDISMDSSYRKELQSALKGKVLTLPQVFVRGNHVGGAEEIKQLNEAGELAKLLARLPVVDPWSLCETCGGARFVPCPGCSGSRKVFDEVEGRLRRCPDCNENGLIHCPGCSSRRF